MDQGFIDILKKIVEKHGKEYFLEFKKCRAILSDYAGSEYNNVRGLFLRAVETGASNAIFSAEIEDIERCAKAQHRVLHEEQFMDSAAAWNVINVLAFILRDIPIKEIQAEPEPGKDSKSGGGTYDDAVNLFNDEQYDKALIIFQALAKENHAGAQNYIGNCYYNGKGVARDYDDAVLWYRRSANQGYAQAQRNLGTCYFSGNGVTENFEKAVELFRKGVDQGHVSSMNDLGFCYFQGKGVPQDYDKALELWREAAEQGSIAAQNNLGYLYKAGKGVSKNYDKALLWFHKAADQGSVFANEHIGNCYRDGTGVPQDYKKAAEWYRKGVDKGSDYAKKELDKLIAEGKI